MSSPGKAITLIPGLLLRGIFSLYRWFLSPLIHLLAGPGFGCRFQPTCGEYAHEALRLHGLFRGGLLAIGRLSRCHPLSSPGYDPVPSCPRAFAKDL